MTNSRRFKWPKFDFAEANWISGVLHICAATLAVSALLSNEWIIIEAEQLNQTNSEPLSFDVTHNDRCTNLGCLDFWRPVRFGGFLDENGKTHIAFHSEGRVLLDCVTPLIANLFYILIALCFVIALVSTFSTLLNLFPPPHPFLHWLKRNTILEMCNMVLTLFCCVIAIMAQSEEDSIRPMDQVSLGTGVFFVCFAGLFSFAAAAAQLRHSTRLNRLRRMDNQRLMCARSLRSWRDAARRPEDVLPIVDFERYLDSATSMTDLHSHSNPVATN